MGTRDMLISYHSESFTKCGVPAMQEPKPTQQKEEQGWLIYKGCLT